MRLDSHQQAAADAPQSHVRIDAGAGTGKTTTLVARAVMMAAGYDRVRILTFSRRAARVLRARLQDDSIPEAVRERITVDTHHGMAAALLREHGHLVGWLPGWTVVDRVEEERLKKEAKDQGDILANRVQRAQLRTYDQLLPAACGLLGEYQMIGEMERYATAYLVDECHDCTGMEWDLSLCLGQENLTVVGDLAQRIYGWRGALDYRDVMFEDAWTRHVLPRNYRSGSAILSQANRLPIEGRIDLRPGTAEQRTGLVQHWEEASDEAMTERLLRDPDLRRAPEEWAILTRTTRRLERVAEQLKAAGVPVRAPSITGKKWDAPESRALVDLLQVVANPHSSIHLGRVLERAGWSRGQLLDAEFGRSDPSRPSSLWDWACHHVDPGSRAAEALRHLTWIRSVALDAVDGVGLDAHQVAIGLAGRGLASEIDLPEWDGLTPEGALAWLADPDRDEEAGDPGVYLGTIHSAKGEEYPRVMLLGMEEGSLPTGRWATETRPEEERIAEERRLLYVGITRAMDRLILARGTERWQRGRGSVPVQASRFLAEIDRAEQPAVPTGE